MAAFSVIVAYLKQLANKVRGRIGIGYAFVLVFIKFRQYNSFDKGVMTDINICVLGDDLVMNGVDGQDVGWIGRLAESANLAQGPITFYYLGVRGQTSEQVAERLEELTVRLPKGADNRLILGFGLADTLMVDQKPQLSSQASAEALKKIVLATRSHYKMFMVGLAPVYDPQRNSRLKRLNGVYRDMCSKARIPFVDVFATLADDVQYKRELVQGDKVNPGSKGHQKIFDLVANDRAWWFS